MKKIKRILVMLLAVTCLTSGLSWASLTVHGAAAATFSVSGGGKVTQGNTVSVTVSVSGSDIMSYAKVSLNYDGNILEYQSGADSGGSGRVSILFDCGEGAKSATRTITFKGKAVGSSSISLDTAEATTMGSASVLPEMMTTSISGGASVTVNAPVQASADAHIGWMDISPGTLSPAFNKDVFEYNVEVENSVTKVTVSALADHPKASIASVKGGSNLKVGKNTITVTCKAENGNTAQYTIFVTRKEGEVPPTTEPTDPPLEEPDTPTEERKININGVDWFLSEDFKAGLIPEGFEEAAINYQGTEIKGVKFSKGDLYLIYLVDAQKKNGNFYIYYTETGTIEELVKLSFIEGSYVIFLSPEQYQGVPEGLVESQFAIEDRNLRGWQLDKGTSTTGSAITLEESLTLEGVSADPGQFYFVYGMNQEGNMGWYTIDTQENTIQRFAMFTTGQERDDMAEQVVSEQTEPDEVSMMKKKIEVFQLCILGMAALVVILIVIMIILLVKGRKSNSQKEIGEQPAIIEETKATEETIQAEQTEEKEVTVHTEKEAEEVEETEEVEELEKIEEIVQVEEDALETGMEENPKDKQVELPKQSLEAETEDDFGLEFIDLDEI